MGTCAQFWAWFQHVNWLEWAKATFDLIKGIAWPIGIFALAFIFRDAIRALIPYIKEVGPGGIKIGTQQPLSQQQNTSLLTATPHPLSTVNARIDQIQSILANIIPEQREASLVRALAEARTLAEFEFIFANIFQSQVDALDKLANSDVTISEAEEFFKNEVVVRNKDVMSAWGFENWSNYLRAQGLVLVEGDNVVITDKGRDFLTFVKEAKTGFTLIN